ncbi:hypothetical protein HY346_01830 [Candidatus Microgenomates bacterium]|nr:hypothetical protein [Candidatus Microgenomates bacterium]
MSAYIGIGLKIALVLTHNKGPLQNIAQVTFVESRTEVRQFAIVDDLGNPVLGEDGNPLEIPYRVITALAQPHELVTFQIVPQGVTRPANMGNLEPSYKVIYGPDQPSHTRRFFNWGLKRATDYGADIVAFLDATGSFSAGDLDNQFDFAERTWGRIIKARVQQALGAQRRQVLKESLSLTAALAGLRTRIDEEGLSRG